MAILKRLMEHNKLNFIFSIGSSGRKLENMQAAYTSFFKQALYRKISFLGEADARDLITRPVEGVLSFDLDAVDFIYEITSGHPYFIQLICHELFSVSQKSNDWQVSKTDVEAVLDAVIERGTVNLKFVWDESSELEKWVLSSLAQFDKPVDMVKLEDFLGKQKVRFIHQDLESAVLHLREKDVLASGNRFVIYLLKLWLIQNRSMEQVREELTRVNPIVSRLLQVGHEYLDQGELEKAVDSFQEALQAEEDNLEVRMGLSSAYMAREDYGRAGAEYEEILALYPDDVAAQSGYCDAYLALGDVRFAMGRLDEAEYAYQQVLKISPKHSDGRAHMAQLFHHRAVSAISGGEDVALEQALKALEFTPNDKGLQASVHELESLADGKGEIRDVLLSWGQRAKQNERWQDAADLLSAYQRLKGEDEHALSILDDLREKARIQELDGLKVQAQRLERLNQYDDAIFTLNKYLSLEPDDAGEIPARIQALKEARKQAQLEEGRGISKPFW
ncbi:MAG: tetratricopeptide repeat protein, partial [Anaerolineales bacterium]|nr:tetratricopeptide repeat protein [Anaerolineales bacterium]